MRRLLFACLIIISGTLTLVAAGCREKSSESQASGDGDKGSSVYHLVFDKTYQDILGCRLPKSATGVHAHITFGSGPWVGYVVANLPKEDMGKLIQELRLQEEKNLLNLWPDALVCDEDSFSAKHWNLTDTNDVPMYYYEDPVKETRLFLTYVAGKVYFRRETKYYVSGTNEENEFLYKKKLRSGE